MSERDPKPEVLRLEELALQVKVGDIKLPRFQRPFVWKRPDMLKLLDSIYKGYPIGSLLLWRSSQRLKSERSIAGLDVDDKDLLYPTNYLLDGQQRLTTLCGALFWNGDTLDSVWNIHFDLEREIFIHPRDTDDGMKLFPLNRLIGTSDFIRQCMKFEHLPGKQVYVDRAERLLRSIKDYKIAVVKIGDMSLEDVAPIFERINSTGRKLTMVDLMMAATWSNDFDLADEILRIRRACYDLGFGEVPDAVILRSIAAVADLGINKDDIQKLRSLSPKQLRVASRECLVALSAACEFFIAYTPVKDFGFLPYALQLNHVTEIFRICPKPSPEQKRQMVAWFWQTSATQYFGGASTGQNSQDLLKIRKFASGLSGSLVDGLEIDISRLIFDKFNLRNASSTTFALLLLNESPHETFSGKAIPQEIFEIKSASMFASLGPSRIRTMNVSRVVDPGKSKTIPSAIGSNFSWHEHLLSLDCVVAVQGGDAYSFVQERAKIIAGVVEELTGCNAKFHIPADFDFSSEDLLKELGFDNDEEDRDEDFIN